MLSFCCSPSAGSPMDVFSRYIVPIKWYLHVSIAWEKPRKRKAHALFISLVDFGTTYLKDWCTTEYLPFCVLSSRRPCSTSCFGVICVLFACYSQISEAMQWRRVSILALLLAAHMQRVLFKAWLCWRPRHFERPQLFHLNNEMAVKRGFSAFWWW